MISIWSKCLLVVVEIGSFNALGLAFLFSFLKAYQLVLVLFQWILDHLYGFRSQTLRGYLAPLIEVESHFHTWLALVWGYVLWVLLMVDTRTCGITIKVRITQQQLPVLLIPSLEPSLALYEHMLTLGRFSMKQTLRVTHALLRLVAALLVRWLYQALLVDVPLVFSFVGRLLFLNLHEPALDAVKLLSRGRHLVDQDIGAHRIAVAS